MASSSAVSSPPSSPSSPADNDVMFIPIDLESSFGRLKRPHSMVSSSSELSLSASTAASHSKASSRNSLTRTSLKTPFVDAAAPTAATAADSTPAAAATTTTTTSAALLVSNHNDEQSNSSSTTNESTTTKTTTNNSATTSSKHQQQSLFKPYPISETTDEIVERRRLSESASVIMGFVSSASTSPSFDRSDCDQHSMMEVTVDGLSSSSHHTTPPTTEEFDFALSAEEEGSLVNEVESVYNTTTNSRGGFCWDTPITIDTVGTTTLLQQHQQDELMSSSLDVPFSVSYSKSMTQHQEEEEHPDETFPICSTDMDW